jgi:PPOX class probable F420-dependent enzyme
MRYDLGMMKKPYLDLLERPLLAILATLMPDGSPQATPLWFDYDGRIIRVNVARGRVKDHNMRRDPRVALAIVDDANPYRYVQIRGRVVAIIEGEAALAHIHQLSRRYTGQDWEAPRPDEARVCYHILPEHFSGIW